MRTVVYCQAGGMLSCNGLKLSWELRILISIIVSPFKYFIICVRSCWNWLEMSSIAKFWAWPRTREHWTEKEPLCPAHSEKSLNGGLSARQVSVTLLKLIQEWSRATVRGLSVDCERESLWGSRWVELGVLFSSLWDSSWCSFTASKSLDPSEVLGTPARSFSWVGRESEQEMERCGCAGRKHAGYPGKGITRQLPRELVPVAMEMGQFVKYLPWEPEDSSPVPRTHVKLIPSDMCL